MPFCFFINIYSAKNDPDFKLLFRIFLVATNLPIGRQVAQISTNYFFDSQKMRHSKQGNNENSCFIFFATPARMNPFRQGLARIIFLILKKIGIKSICLFTAKTPAKIRVILLTTFSRFTLLFLLWSDRIKSSKLLRFIPLFFLKHRKIMITKCLNTSIFL